MPLLTASTSTRVELMAGHPLLMRLHTGCLKPEVRPQNLALAPHQVVLSAGSTLADCLHVHQGGVEASHPLLMHLHMLIMLAQCSDLNYTCKSSCKCSPMKDMLTCRHAHIDCFDSHQSALGAGDPLHMPDLI